MGRMTSFFTASATSPWLALAACWVETTTLLMRTGLPS